MRDSKNELAFTSLVVHSRFFDSANPASNFELYLQQLQDLSTIALSLKAKVVVNTCGWVEGLGAEIAT
jgi:polynucleotide 5'-kinase involved in rRNA processing